MLIRMDCHYWCLSDDAYGLSIAVHNQAIPRQGVAHNREAGLICIKLELCNIRRWTTPFDHSSAGRTGPPPGHLPLRSVG